MIVDKMSFNYESLLHKQELYDTIEWHLKRTKILKDELKRRNDHLEKASDQDMSNADSISEGVELINSETEEL